jgi:ABC-2 type transport system permease protein
MKKVWLIVRKEWAEVFRNRLVLFTVAFLPLMLTALPLVVLYVSRGEEGLGGASMGDMPAGFQQLCVDLSAGECAQYFFVSQFLLLFMIMPLVIPATIASYSIVGEKTTRTLEPLLATPVTTIELLAGKGLAAAIPAILATWLGFTVFAIGASLMAIGPGVLARLVDPLWLSAVFVVGPLLAVLAVSAAVMISSRVNDPRVAEQLSALVILPVMAVFFGQIAGLFFLNARLILWMGLGLLIVDAGMLAFATQLFQRENILVRWK